ncbi:hypothetical protein JCM10207_005732 [Rhodosporidiobolus poonsookiae]
MAVLPSFPPLLGYLPREHIASGGQSSVYRALNPTTEHLAALKVVPLVVTQASEAAAIQAKAKQLVREMRIHETLQHRNILRLFGGETREGCEVELPREKGRRPKRVDWPSGLYMLLDLADGGDLFDKIVPDVGVAPDIAHLFFRQLVSGLKYLNHHGICHRDIKPENCLLSGQGNLQISDFGLATVFKYKGQERLLKDRCGSPPYAAPELARPQPYAAEPIDVWSAGVVLFALLFGNTPWDEPTSSSPEFAMYLSCAASPTSPVGVPHPSAPIWQQEPWNRLSPDSGAAQMLFGLLTIDAERRPKLKEVEALDWFRQPNPLLNPSTGLVTDPQVLLDRLLKALREHEYVGPPAEAYDELMALADPAITSQQPPSATQAAMSQAYSQRGLDPAQTFRSSMQLYSRLSMAPTQRTNPNLTRFFTTQPLPVLVSLLTRVLDSLSLPTSSSSTTGKAYELIYSSPSAPADVPAAALPTVEEVQAASLNTLFVRFRIRSVDRRKQHLWAGLYIRKSILPADVGVRASQQPQGQEMDIDSDDDDAPAAGGRGAPDEEEKGEEGLDVVCQKRDADPLEIKRLWREIVQRMPEGVVVAT